MNSYKRKWIVKGIFFGTIIFALVTLGTMYLWNNLLVGLFGLPEITYLQTLGLMVIGRLLTGGFGHRGGHHRRHWGGRRWRERWQRMSEEERQAFMQRCGWQWQEEYPGKEKNAETQAQN